MRELSELGISPAPWKAGNFDVMTGEHVVAEVYDGLGGDENTENKEMIISNARLIAAAQNMYQKSYELIDAFDRREMKPEHINALRAALAKAAGEDVCK